MTYGEKFKEVFGYYPETMPCPVECPSEFQGKHCISHKIKCEYFLDFREKEYVDPEEKEYLDKEDQVDTSPEHLSDVDEETAIYCGKCERFTDIGCRKCPYYKRVLMKEGDED